MAYAMTKQGSLDNCVTYEFICDTITDMNAIENRYRTIGSVAVVLQGESDGLEVYIAGSDKQWNNLGSMGASNSQGGSSGLSIYICAQNEVSNGLPDIDNPDESTIYLVPASETSGNLYSEYIYVDDDWELFGGANIDLSGYATVTDTVLNTTLSRGRNINASNGFGSIAFGSDVAASGTFSQAFGESTNATDAHAHAEGYLTMASGTHSHAEGHSTTASNSTAHAEGDSTTASGMYSHAEGYSTIASGGEAHSEGVSTTASGSASHAEGDHTIAYGVSAHAEGMGGTYTLNGTTYESKAVGTTDHTEGYQCLTTDGMPGNHAEGYQTRATGGGAHSEGQQTVASGFVSHAEGYQSTASAAYTHAEGYQTAVSTLYGHAEGYQTTASGTMAHAEGSHTQATHSAAHAEGLSTIASGVYSHAEGNQTQATNDSTHAEGLLTIASGIYSHAEGVYTIAKGNGSHVSGTYNIADDYSNWTEWVANTPYSVGDKVKVTDGSTISGYICKTANSDSSFTSSKWTDCHGKMNYVEIIGNGSADDARSNARALDWDGNERLKGDLYVGCNSDSTGGTKVATEAYVNTRVPAPPINDGNYILKVNVISGTPTYSWVALSDLSGVTF